MLFVSKRRKIMRTELKGIRLDHLNLTVTDLEETIDWYGRVFGFEVVERDVQEGVPWVVLRAGDSMLCLYEYPARQVLGRFGLDERGLHGMNHFSLSVEDETLWQAIVESESLDVRYGGVIEWPHSRSWYVQDPTGHEIEVTSWHANEPNFEGQPIEGA
jgi:catechol 2,3-dioxygenase-like lactoylglutathione lyase family enzyme